MNLGQKLDVKGVTVYPEALNRATQEALLTELRGVVRQAPLFTPETMRGRKMSVRMTSAGAWGWVSDRRGYRYEPQHPSGVSWPDIPQPLLELWSRVVPQARQPETALFNFYGADARMGLHQDKDEADLSQPVVSVSLGDEALFRVGGTERGGQTSSVWLRSGDVAVLDGAARLAFHGIDRVKHGSSSLLSQGGRLNITLRVVTA